MAVQDEFYVYELIDPRTKLPFYVGRGRGARVKEYYKEDPRVTVHTKVVMEDIKLSGDVPTVKIVSKDLSENESLKLESDLIKKYGRITKDPGGILTNKFAKDKPKSKNNKDADYATIQVRDDIKRQVVDFCNRKGLKIGRFIETLFIQAVSGSNK